MSYEATELAEDLLETLTEKGVEFKDNRFGETSHYRLPGQDEFTKGRPGNSTVMDAFWAYMNAHDTLLLAARNLLCNPAENLGSTIRGLEAAVKPFNKKD